MPLPDPLRHFAQLPKPTVIVPDTAPLIHLAVAGQLALLGAVGRVVLVDMVVHEATERPDKPYATDISDWIRQGMQPGSNTPVQVVKTEVGELYRNTKLLDPGYKSRNAGELAILAWLAETVETTADNVMVVYENGKVPDLIRCNAMDANIAVVTTRAFLHYAERQGLATGAESLWQGMVDKVPAVNPQADVFVRFRPGEEP